jgi:hypothetical protein
MAQYALTAALANPRPAATSAATGATPLNRPLTEQAWLGERHVHPVDARHGLRLRLHRPNRTRLPAQRRTGSRAITDRDERLALTARRSQPQRAEPLPVR